MSNIILRVSGTLKKKKGTYLVNIALNSLFRFCKVKTEFCYGL